MQKYLYQDLYELEENHWWHISKRELVLSLIKKNISDRKNFILDVGCGTGKNIESFSELGICQGIDSSADAITFCKKRQIKKATLGSVEKIPFPKQSFNIVTALDVIEHVNDSKALAEIHRVLKQSGIIIATVPAYPGLWSKWDEVLHHKRRYTKKSLAKVLELNKFKILKISYVYSFLVIPVFFIRLIKKMFFKKHYPSDFKLSSPLINLLLKYLSGIEQFIIINSYVPFGTSIIVVAQKR